MNDAGIGIVAWEQWVVKGENPPLDRTPIRLRYKTQSGAARGIARLRRIGYRTVACTHYVRFAGDNMPVWGYPVQIVEVKQG